VIHGGRREPAKRSRECDRRREGCGDGGQADRAKITLRREGEHEAVQRVERDQRGVRRQEREQDDRRRVQHRALAGAEKRRAAALERAPERQPELSQGLPRVLVLGQEGGVQIR
jgi:hypothetical protein